MAEFDKFKDDSTHMQPVETNAGEWQARLDEDDKRLYKQGGGFKRTGLGATAVVVGLTSLALASPAVLAALPAALFCYAYGAALEAQVKNEVEKKYDDRAGKLKNFARQLIKPFS
jgi:hypothetical protein